MPSLVILHEQVIRINRSKEGSKKSIWYYRQYAINQNFTISKLHRKFPYNHNMLRFTKEGGEGEGEAFTYFQKNFIFKETSLSYWTIMRKLLIQSTRTVCSTKCALSNSQFIISKVSFPNPVIIIFKRKYSQPLNHKCQKL